MSKNAFDSYEKKMFESTLNKMDDDLALIVILSCLSNKPEDLIKAFSTAVQVMAERTIGSIIPFDEYDEESFKTIKPIKKSK